MTAPKLSRRVPLKPGACQKCGLVLSGGRYLDGVSKGNRGDFVICRCGTILIIDADFQPVPTVPADFAKSSTDTLRNLTTVSDTMRRKAAAS